MDVARVSFYVT